jgi:hypothetical protein
MEIIHFIVRNVILVLINLANIVENVINVLLDLIIIAFG